MKFSVVSVMAIGLLALVIPYVSAAPVADDSGETNDNVDKFMKPLLARMAGFLNVMKTAGSSGADPKAQSEKFANSQYIIEQPIPDKDGKTSSASSFLATGFQALLSGFLKKDPKLAQLAVAATDPNLIKYVTEMIDGDQITDLLQLAIKSPGIRKLYSDVVNAFPLFAHLKDVIEQNSLQDRVLGETLMGTKPSVLDLARVANSDEDYDVDKLIAAMKKDQQFQDFLKLTLDKEPNIQEALKLLTGKNLPLNGKVDSKYSVTYSDIARNREQVNLGTALLFCFENFTPLMNIGKELLRSKPSITNIVSQIFKMKTSMLAVNDGQKDINSAAN